MASITNKSPPMALVQRWNASTVCVRCPFCTKIHTHGFGGSYESINRASHCSHLSALTFPSYRFKYPFSTHEGTVAYEIDKAAGYCVALGAESIAQEVEPLNQLLNDLKLNEKSRSWEHATETSTIGMEDETFRRLHSLFGGDDTFTLNRLHHVVSRMIKNGDTEYVADFIDSRSGAELFLLGTNKQGQTALHLAACEAYEAMIKLLLHHGVNLNAQDKNGRAPLMEAALWGRIDNVKHLLEYGADGALHDSQGRQAANMAELSERNDEECYERSGAEYQVYRENTFLVNQGRRVILEWLKDPKETSRRATFMHDQVFDSHFFRKTFRGTIELVALIVEYPVKNEWKTVASSQRPSGFEPLAAMSGWDLAEKKITVSGREWTVEVMRISSVVGHQLGAEKQKDQETQGQYFASHAEKQLTAYFISKHVLIEAEGEGLLQQAKPPILLTKATILVSRPPCDDCLRFIETVNSGSLPGNISA